MDTGAYGAWGTMFFLVLGLGFFGALFSGDLPRNLVTIATSFFAGIATVGAVLLFCLALIYFATRPLVT